MTKASTQGGLIMLVTFQSTAAPDVVMLRNLAQYLLGLIGKHLDARGVIAHEELPHAIERMEAAISEETHAETALESLYTVTGTHRREMDDAYGGVARRAWPLLDMMREARKHNADIIWGL
jgi:Mg2+/Co2+ transporter CorB